MGLHDGHREKKREQFLSAGLDSFADHEVLELLLFYAIPRRDTNETAHRLLERFGSLDAVFAAPVEELCKVEGIGRNAAALITLVPRVYSRVKRSAAERETVLNTTRKAGRYLMDQLAAQMGEEGEYVCMVGFLTTASHMEWSQAAIERQKEMYPNMTLIDVERVETEDSMEVAYEKAKELLKTYPNLKGFLGTSSYDAPGAGKAITELGLGGKCVAVGTSVTSCCADQLSDESMAAALCWDPATAGYAMNVLAQMVLEGRESEIVNGFDLGVEGYESLNVNGKYLNGAGWIVINKDNMSEYNF